MLETLKKLYEDYPEMPYFSPHRDLASFLKEASLSKSALVPKKNMQRNAEGLLPGHIILLWRVSHGNYNTETPVCKYFEYDYGIDGHASLQELVEKGYVIQENAQGSLVHLSGKILQSFLKEKGVKGLSKLNREETEKAMLAHFSEEELENLFSLRVFRLSAQGQQMLEKAQDIVHRHPQKKIYKQ